MPSKHVNVARTFSSEVVEYLRKSRTLKEIGALIGLGESFISLVGRGERNFTVEHLIALEKSLNKPLPTLILEALQESVSEDMKSQYGDLLKIIRESGESRTSLAKEEDSEKTGRHQY